MLKLPAGSTIQYSGSDIRFLFPNGRYAFRVDGVGIDISAVGKGAVSAIGVGTTGDGTMATNGGKASAARPRADDARLRGQQGAKRSAVGTGSKH